MSGEPPEVSVVIGARDVADSIQATLQSILEQDDVRLEVVVVDDGSTDATWSLLESMAAEDARVRPLRQESQGLTAALRLGCGAARGHVIARQDAGPRNRSLPGRFRRMADVLDGHPDVSLVSCAARYFTSDGLHIEDLRLSADDVEHGLHRLDITRVRGVAHHAATAFRRSQYNQVGGYRLEFRFAQDLDLWLRLAELGRHVALDEVLVECTRREDGTSFLYRDLQLALAHHALEAARLRRRGASEQAALAASARISAQALPGSGRARRAAGHYALGAQLRVRHPGRARSHFRAAALLAPWHLKAWIRWLGTRG